jgi:hypothetical protein
MLCSAFHCSISWFLEMQFGVTYFKTWGTTQPFIAFSTLIFCSCFFVFGRTNGTEFSYTATASICRVLGQVFWVGSWMGLVFFILQSEVQSPFPPLVLGPSSVSVKCRCVNFEPQEARIIKLLRMVRSRRWKNDFFVHFHVCLLTQ